jgi:hypothetical protein
MLTLNHIFAAERLAPASIAAALHRVPEPRLARALPWLAQERRDVFTAYQSTQKGDPAATLRRRQNLASFVQMPDLTMLFAGLWTVAGCRDRPRREIGADPNVRVLIEEFGTCLEFAGEPEGNWTWFDLVPSTAMSDYTGRLRIANPTARNMMRLAENFDVEIAAIEAQNALSAAPPDWAEMIVTGLELRALPASWAARLREWRGVYLIVDQTDGARYVGSAYGADNLLGRWRAHVQGDQGITAKLRARNPAHFHFAILERMAPDDPAEDVIAREMTWIARQDTRRHGLNA